MNCSISPRRDRHERAGESWGRLIHCSIGHTPKEGKGRNLCPETRPKAPRDYNTPINGHSGSAPLSEGIILKQRGYWLRLLI